MDDFIQEVIEFLPIVIEWFTVTNLAIAIAIFSASVTTTRWVATDESQDNNFIERFAFTVCEHSQPRTLLYRLTVEAIAGVLIVVLILITALISVICLVIVQAGWLPRQLSLAFHDENSTDDMEGGQGR